MVEGAGQADLISYIVEVWRSPRSPFASFCGGLRLSSQVTHPYSLLRPSLSDFRQVLDGNGGLLMTFLERGLEHQRRLALGLTGLESSETVDLLRSDTKSWADRRFSGRVAFRWHEAQKTARTARKLRESLRVLTRETTVRTSVAERALLFGRNSDEVVAIYSEGIRLFTDGTPVSPELSRFSLGRGAACYYRYVELVSLAPGCPLMVPDLDLGAGITGHPIEILRDPAPETFRRLIGGRRESLGRYLADLGAHETEIGRVLSELPGSPYSIALQADHSFQAVTTARVQGTLTSYLRRSTVAATDTLRGSLVELSMLSHSRIGLASEAIMTSQGVATAVHRYLGGLQTLFSRTSRSGGVAGVAVAFLGLSLVANSA